MDTIDRPRPADSGDSASEGAKNLLQKEALEGMINGDKSTREGTSGSYNLPELKLDDKESDMDGLKEWEYNQKPSGKEEQENIQKPTPEQGRNPKLEINPNPDNPALRKPSDLPADTAPKPMDKSVPLTHA
ncbi:MAG: hypothetical protein IT342_00635 [Candidatus Melainabacteria bacterium]|nr:hypothetical protein [Candidatus Melainabacteria bacterium]